VIGCHVDGEQQFNLLQPLAAQPTKRLRNLDMVLEQICDDCLVLRTAVTVPGYMSVARAGEVLHLAPRTVRDLIYSGRLPSQRVGRRHYLRAADVEQERRRRLGLPTLPRAVAAAPRPRKLTVSAPRAHANPELRRQRALERAAQVARWGNRRPAHEANVPFTVEAASDAFVCASCSRRVKAGRTVREVPGGDRLCLTCGRRAVLDWADRRRFEAQSARRFARQLGSSQSDASQSAA
jgi:excisionase family DNA binding protein